MHLEEKPLKLYVLTKKQTTGRKGDLEDWKIATKKIKKNRIEHEGIIDQGLEKRLAYADLLKEMGNKVEPSRLNFPI